MKLAIVIDSDNCATLLQQTIIEGSEHSISWVANNESDALAMNIKQPVDLILLGLLSANIDGATITQKIMDSSPCAILIVTSDVDQNANMIFSSMASGALDVIQSPLNNLNCDSKNSFTAELLNKFSIVERLIKKNTQPALDLTDLQDTVDNSFPIVCIGASTGGPGSLITLLNDIPADSNATYVIIQHVDKNFIGGLAEWLNSSVGLSVTVAEQNQQPKPGHVYIAGGDEHLLINNKLAFEYTPEPVDYSYRPSIDIFFNSVCENWSGTKLGVLLTGMGDDGAQGLLHLKQHGAYTIAQDEETCAVFGMPRAAIKLNAAAAVLPINSIAGRITRKLTQISISPVEDSTSIL